MIVPNNIEINSMTDGIVISLFRRPINKPGFKDTDKGFPFLAFGYFDGIRIDKKHTLCELYSIDHTLEDSKYSLFEEQHLYLYQTYNDKEREKRIDSIISSTCEENNNLLVITELKIDERILISNNLDICKEEINNRIQEIISYAKSKQIENYPCDFNFEMFNSLSYSDFVIIFRSNTYEEIDFIINNLRLWKVDDISFFKSTYSVLGFPNIAEYSDIFPSKKYFDSNSNCDITIQSTTKPSKKVEEIKQDIKKFINNLMVNETLPEIQIKTIFGKYDIEIIIKGIKLYQIIRLRGLLLETFKNYIQCTNTIFLFDVPYIPLISKNNKISISQKSIRHLEDTKQKETGWVSSSNSFNIFSNEFRELVRKFQHILVNESIDTLVLLEINQLLKTINFNSNSALIHETITMISEYIDQQNQASRLIFEMPSLNSQIIGSVVSINGFYASIVECFEEIIFKELDRNSDWSIFISMNHSTTVDSYQYFPDSKPTVNTKRQELVAISICKTPFFELKNFIPYLFHEIGHYLPPFEENIEKLHLVLIKGITYDIGQLILLFLHNKVNYFVFSHKNIMEFGHKTIVQLSDYFQKELLIELKKIMIGGISIINLPLNDYTKNKIFDVISYKLFGQYSSTIFDLYTFDDDVVNLQKIIDQIIPNLFTNFNSLLENIMNKITDTDLPEGLKNEFMSFYDYFPTIEETFSRLLTECINSSCLSESFVKHTESINRILSNNKFTIDKIISMYALREKNNFQKDLQFAIVNLKNLLINNKKRVALLWEKPIDILFSEITNSVELIAKESISDNKNIVGYFEEIEPALINLSLYGVLEDTPKNRKIFFDLLLTDLTCLDTKKAIESDVSILFNIIKETRADYYMCKFLDINHSRYLQIADDNLIKQSLYEHDDLFTFRSTILEKVISENSITSDSEISNLHEGVKRNINHLYYSLYHNDLIDYLVNIQSVECQRIEEINGSIISELREMYNEIVNSHENSFSQEVKMMEHFINKGNAGWRLYDEK